MTAAKHLARTEFIVKCPDGLRRHGGQFREPGRAQHWAAQAPAAACCRTPGDHEVVPVAPERRT